VTFLDDGSQSDTIPAIVLTSGDGSEVIATGFSRIEEEIGEYDVYGRFNSVNEIEDQPISINIDLHKVGRGGDGGDLIIGGKAPSVQDGIARGIEVFNINVLGAGNDDPNGMMTKPSSLGTIESTRGALKVVNIATDPVYAAGDTYASLEVRDGFGGNLSLINADAFLGDLKLDADNAETITAQGGGDVDLDLSYTWTSGDGVNSVTTGGGDDVLDIDISGDTLDHAGWSFSVATGDGNDRVEVEVDAIVDGTGFSQNGEQLNQAILDNISIDTGADDDVILLSGNGVANINAGSGDDTIVTEAISASSSWWFNFDAARLNAIGGLATVASDVPGEQTSLAYVGGATVTVTLSGAGVDGDSSAGGGVMAFDNDDPTGASAGQDGYEASSVISDLINGNDFYGDQRDVNAAIIDAIENDPILSQLLTATIGSNNTLKITSMAGGAYDSSDLRIEIERPTLDSWTAVQTEARSVFSDSTIAVSSVADADAPTGQDLESSGGADAWFDGLSAAGDEANSTNAGVGEGESNHPLYSQWSPLPSDLEVDTVINGGAGDDLIVLNTASTYSPPEDFTVSSNNALLNGASNETIVLTGDDFGDDTVMNFTTGVQTQTIVANTATVTVISQGADAVSGSPEVPAEPEVFVLELSDAEAGESGTIDFAGGSVTVVDTDTAESLVAKFLDAGFAPTGWETSAGETGSTVTFTSTVPGALTNVDVSDFTTTGNAGGVLVGTVTTDEGSDLVAEGTGTLATTEGFIVTFGNSTIDTTYLFDGETIPVLEDQLGSDIAAAVANGVYDNWEVTGVQGATVSFQATEANVGDIADVVDSDFIGANIETIVEIAASPLDSGTDFLDFTAYLTSEEDVSTGTPDSTDSEQTIAVTLNHNPASAAPGADIQANEVVTIVYTDDTSATGTFANLSAADIEGLFSAVDFDGGALAAADFDVVDSQTDDQVVDGNGKAIIMVENAGNDGEYKVFELTWDASEGDGDEGVSAVEIGSLDFGDSLHDLYEVNLVGSDSHATLLETGFNTLV
jgi:hypothetical protein